MINLTPCTDQRVTTGKLRAKPRHMSPLVYGIQPQGYLRQLHCNGIQVNAIDIPVGNKHLYPLQFSRPPVKSNPLSKLLLLFIQIGLRKLRYGLIQESRGTHCRLTDRHIQNFIRLPVFQKFFQGILYQTLCQNLRRIVGSGFFALPSRQAVDKSAFLVHSKFSLTSVILITDAFLLCILIQFTLRYKISYIQFVKLIPCSLYFI